MQSIYKVEIDGLLFSFKTDKGIKYVVEFIKDTTFGKDDLSELIYSLSFYQYLPLSADSDKKIKKGFDEKIKRTIIHIISSFFERENVIIIYNCESIDNKQKSRNKLFHKWFADFCGSHYQRLNASIISEESSIEYYISAITKTTNPHLPAFKKEFEDNISEFSSYK